MKYTFLSLITLSFVFLFQSCTKNPDSESSVQLVFNNTFKGKTIQLGDDVSAPATTNISAKGQLHHFSELKYVISNIRLINHLGQEIPFHPTDLDKGAFVINQADPGSLTISLTGLPNGEYVKLKFGLGITTALNTLDQQKFPGFYALAGANNASMMWEWGYGYRFAKIEGYYGTTNQPLSIHIGSTIKGKTGNFTQGVDAYREIQLEFPKQMDLNQSRKTIEVDADFDYLLSGKAHQIILKNDDSDDSNALPSIHSALEMVKFLDNIGGNGTTDLKGMFSIQKVQ